MGEKIKVYPPGKLEVSSGWTEDERNSVASLIDARMGELQEEAIENSRAVHWAAPAVVSLPAKVLEQKELLSAVKNGSAEFLEANRRNFRYYVKTDDFIEVDSDLIANVKKGLK